MTSFLHLPLLFCPSHRKPCLKAASYNTASPIPTEGTHIWVAPKSNRQKQLQNVFLNNWGFPDQSNNYNHLFHNIDGGPVLQMLWHPMPDLDGPIDLCFNSPFIPKQHKDLIGINKRTSLTLTLTSRNRLTISSASIGGYLTNGVYLLQ